MYTIKLNHYLGLIGSQELGSKFIKQQLKLMMTHLLGAFLIVFFFALMARLKKSIRFGPDPRQKHKIKI